MSEAAVQGRIRFRNDALKVAEFAYSIRDSLLEIKGVCQAQVNKRVGSVLILFDKTKVSVESILNKIAEKLGVDMAKVKSNVGDMKKALTSKKSRKLIKRGLLGSTAVMLGGLYFSKSWHVAAGAAFVHLLALHLYQNKRTLMK